jgi:Uncharacterized small protein (DUF2292)
VEKLTFAAELATDNFERPIREIVRAITSVSYGSVEVTIHNSSVILSRLQLSF